ncbi:deoxycytidylate deaminase [Dermatophagoides pteronyssinus]|uniref:deoxycytidylate deaminase n=1 Tax=Dermatophagoides pteronyssinus TaxID=6956 RepID=UPI003F667760
MGKETIINSKSSNHEINDDNNHVHQSSSIDYEQNSDQSSSLLTNLLPIPPVSTGKRNDYLIWWDYFMSIAYIVSLRSKDPNTRVGACIVNDENRIVGLGYNGMPNNCSDDELPWFRTNDDPMQIKYLYVCHAEMNAILNKNSYDCKNCSIFVLLFPCNDCAKMIIQAGIKRIVYLSDRYSNDIKFKASRKLLVMAGIELIKYQPKQRQILIDFDRFIDK